MGIDKAVETKAAKLAKNRTNDYQKATKKFKQPHRHLGTSCWITLFIRFKYYSAYGYDEFKSKKNDFILESIEFIANQKHIDQCTIKFGWRSKMDNLALDLGNCPGNICFQNT